MAHGFGVNLTKMNLVPWTDIKDYQKLILIVPSTSHY